MNGAHVLLINEYILLMFSYDEYLLSSSRQKYLTLFVHSFPNILTNFLGEFQRILACSESKSETPCAWDFPMNLRRVVRLRIL